MATGEASHPVQIDQFFAGPGGRAERLPHLIEVADDWAGSSGRRQGVEAALADITATDAFHAYTGAQLLNALRDQAAANQASATAALARRITRAVLTRPFRQNAGDWNPHEDVD